MARAEAERIRKIGAAEAEAIALVGKAEAEAMKAKAGSYAGFGNAGVSSSIILFMSQYTSELVIIPKALYL